MNRSQLASEEIDALDFYDKHEIEIPVDPRLAKFALLIVPHMEDCEMRGCAQCRRFIQVHVPDLIVSTDKFTYVPPQPAKRGPKVRPVEKKGSVRRIGRGWRFQVQHEGRYFTGPTRLHIEDAMLDRDAWRSAQAAARRSA